MALRALAAARRRLPWIGLAALGAVIAVGISLAARGAVLGAPLPPLIGEIKPGAHPLAFLAAAVLALGVGLARPLRDPRVPPWAVALVLFALALAANLAVNAARFGTHAWVGVFDDSFEANNEYLPALPALSYGAGWFLDHFSELVPALPVHAAGHPPGLLLVMHAFAIDTPNRLAALTIGVGALMAPGAYALGRAVLGDDVRARTAGLLTVFSPVAILVGATSADALYAGVATLAAAGLAARSPRRRALGALGLAVASFLSYSLVAVGAWAVLVALQRDGLRRAVGLALACALALAVFYLALAALAGFDLPGALKSTEEVYRAGVASMRPYAFWVFGSPAAFGFALGLPLVWLAFAALRDATPTGVALAVVILIAAVGGFTKAETERIWLFFVPLAAVAAASVLGGRRVTLVLVALAAQALAMELLFGTVW